MQEESVPWLKVCLALFSLMGCDSVSSRAKIIARKFWLISAQSRWSVNTMIARDFSEMGLIWTRLRWNYNKLKEAWIFCCKSLCFLIVSVGGCYPGDISFLPFILSFTCLSFTTPSLRSEWLQYTFSSLGSFLFSILLQVLTDGIVYGVRWILWLDFQRSITLSIEYTICPFGTVFLKPG